MSVARSFRSLYSLSSTFILLLLQAVQDSIAFGYFDAARCDGEPAFTSHLGVRVRRDVELHPVAGVGLNRAGKPFVHDHCARRERRPRHGYHQIARACLDAGRRLSGACDQLALATIR